MRRVRPNAHLAAGRHLDAESGRPESSGRSLRKKLPFKRLAVVLTGGGAYGAYEVGVLRVLHALGVQPAIVAGVSVGAVNALGWIAHGGDSRRLERAWRKISPASVGIRWSLLGVRAFGSFLVVFGVLQFLLVLADYPQDFMFQRFPNLFALTEYVRARTALELASWLLIAAAGTTTMALSRRVDEILARWTGTANAERLHMVAGVGLLALAGLYVVVMWRGIPWPLGLHQILLLALTVIWLLQRPGPLRSWLGPLWLHLMPETGGRGLWRSAARRQLIKEIVEAGDPERLVHGKVGLMLGACDLATGRIDYFINSAFDERALREALPSGLAEPVVLTKVGDIIEAAVASSAVPVLYEPAQFRGHDYLDAGLFSNQPIHAVLAAGADAVLLVLVSPSHGPRRPRPQANLVEIAGLLSEIANWRDLQTELGRLPAGFSREGNPARICVVEPGSNLEGQMFDFNAKRAQKFIRWGERDAWKALEQAGWLEPAEGRPIEAPAHRKDSRA